MAPSAPSPKQGEVIRSQKRNVPVKSACTPVDRSTVPENACPATGVTGNLEVAGKTRLRVVLGEPAAPRAHPPSGVKSLVAPAHVRLTSVTDAPVVPELDRVM